MESMLDSLWYLHHVWLLSYGTDRRCQPNWRAFPSFPDRWHVPSRRGLLQKDKSDLEKQKNWAKSMLWSLQIASTDWATNEPKHWHLIITSILRTHFIHLQFQNKILQFDNLFAIFYHIANCAQFFFSEILNADSGSGVRQRMAQSERENQKLRNRRVDCDIFLSYKWILIFDYLLSEKFRATYHLRSERRMKASPVYGSCWEANDHINLPFLQNSFLWKTLLCKSFDN